jgi:hypothetical protein
MEREAAMTTVVLHGVFSPDHDTYELRWVETVEGLRPVVTPVGGACE